MGHNASIPSASTDSTFVPINAQKSLVIDPEDAIHVLVPPTRPDILHECDIMEDAAVAYGFDELKKTFPATNTVARPFPINKLSDTLRRLCAEAGWLEVLPLTLCSHDENFKFLNRKDPGTLAVVLANPKTIEYQVVRTSLLPGMLKTIRENRKHALPLRIFEVSDVVVKDASIERQARNVRRVAGVFCGRKAGFEIVHGLLDRLMLGLGVTNLGAGKARENAESGYYIQADDDATYFPNRGAKIYYRPPRVAGVHTTFAPAASADQSNATATASDTEAHPDAESNDGKDVKRGPLDTLKEKLGSVLPTSTSTSSSRTSDIVIGSLGILHPSVLKAFELDYPCSAVEFDLEPFL